MNKYGQRELAYREIEFDTEPLYYNYTVNEVVDNKVVHSTNGSSKSGEVVVPYRRYHLHDGKLYLKNASGGPKGLEYNHYFTLTENNQVETINYEQTDIQNVVFLSEGEDIPGMTLCNNDNMRVRSSNGLAAYAADDPVGFVTLPAGSYRLTAFIHSSYKNPDSYWSFLAGDKEIANLHCTVVNIQELQSEVFILNEKTTLYIPQCGDERNGIDLLYITKEEDVEPATVTANNLTMAYGDDVPTLTYTSEGGALNGTPKLSTTATKTSSVGTYPIKVEKGTVTNEAVTYVDGTLTIEKAPLTVSVEDMTITEGDAIPSFTLIYEGWKNNDTEATAFSVKPSARTTAKSDSKPGTYPITIRSGIAKNYTITYQEGTLTIKQRPIDPATVTANNLTMVYGDDVPTLTYTSEGGALNGTPKLSTTATKASSVGTYPIKVEKGTVTNEAVTYVDGTLTIEKAPLTVRVEDVTITEGDAIPTFPLIYEGWKNNDTEATAFSVKPSSRTTAKSDSKPGTYPITIRSGIAKNYTITYQEGTLTIKEKPVEPATVTANNLTMVYGDDVPTLTYTSEGGALNGTPKLSTTATKASSVGTYPIKVEKGTVTNEAVTYVDGTLTIEKAPLTVSVEDVTITEGDAIPSFPLIYEGWKNNDTEATAFSVKPSARTTARSDSKAGTYPITIRSGIAKNYTITYQEGTLTIEPAAGIESVYADGQGNAVIYNVNGQKLSKPRKGINIISGKKVVVK